MYKYLIFDIDGCLIDSEKTYNETYDSYDEADEEALKEVNRLRDKAAEEYEDVLLTGYEIEEVKNV